MSLSYFEELADYRRIVEHVYAGQVQAYSSEGEWRYDDGPFILLQKPLSASRLVLLTSSGHFVEGADPEPFGVKNMTQAADKFRDKQGRKKRLRLKQKNYQKRSFST